MLQLWEVIGGEDTNGIVVRSGKDLTSPAKSQRLATGAIVQEEELVAYRLRYAKVSGSGPDEGWVSTALKDKPLLRRATAVPDGAEERAAQEHSARMHAATPEAPEGVASFKQASTAEAPEPSRVRDVTEGRMSGGSQHQGAFAAEARPQRGAEAQEPDPSDEVVAVQPLNEDRPALEAPEALVEQEQADADRVEGGRSDAAHGAAPGAPSTGLPSLMPLIRSPWSPLLFLGAAHAATEGEAPRQGAVEAADGSSAEARAPEVGAAGAPGNGSAPPPVPAQSAVASIEDGQGARRSWLGRALTRLFGQEEASDGEDDSEEDEEVEEEAPRSQRQCASPGCPYRVHTNVHYGSFCCIACFESSGREHGDRCERAQLLREAEAQAPTAEGAGEAMPAEEAGKEAGWKGTPDESQAQLPAPKQAEEPSAEDVRKESAAKEAIREAMALARQLQQTADALVKDAAGAATLPSAAPAGAQAEELAKAKGSDGEPPRDPLRPPEDAPKETAKEPAKQDKLSLVKTLQDAASVLLRDGVIEEARRVASKLQDAAGALLKKDTLPEKQNEEPRHADTDLKEEKRKTLDDWRQEAAKHRRSGDKDLLAQTLSDGARAILKDDKFEDARVMAKEAEIMFRQVGSRWRLGVVLDTLAKAHLKLFEALEAQDEAAAQRRRAHGAEARAAAEEAVALLRRIGHPREEKDLASARESLAEARALALAGEPSKAEAAPAAKARLQPEAASKERADDAKAWREAVAQKRQFFRQAPQGRGDQMGLASTLLSAAAALLKEGSFDEASHMAEEAATHFRKLNAPKMLGMSLDMVARVHLRLLEKADTPIASRASELEVRQQHLKAKTAATEAVAMLGRANLPNCEAVLASARCTLLRVDALEWGSSEDHGVVRGMFRALRKKLGGADGTLTLRKTFGFAKGLERPTPFAKFDIRDEICLDVGGFTHGQVVRDKEGSRYVVVGVRLSEEGVQLPQLWFWPKSIDRPASCCFTGLGVPALKAFLSVVGTEALKEVRPEDFDVAEDSEGELVALCHDCLLPLGATRYRCKGGEGFLHGECHARILLDTSQWEESSRRKEESKKKSRDRGEYNIGWRPERMIPCSEDFFQRRKIPRPPGASANSMYCLVLAKDDAKASKVRIVQTSDPESSVNLNFLVTALQVRIRAGMAPYFSLDTPKADEQWQVKTFGPPWLKGTALGGVLFQADYHLKELSMGDSLFEQPAIGMKSCWDFSWNEEAWRGREWFVVKQAKVYLSDNNVLLPHVQMGVEAREQVANDKKQLVDAAVTSKGHPLVKYAELFTHNFDLIAERKSVVYQLREVSRAAIVAKFLVDNKVSLENFWLSVQDEIGLCKMDLPFNREERTTNEILVCDGAIKEQHGGVLSSTVGLYGGVDLNIDAFDLSMPVRVNKTVETPDYAAIYADPSHMGTRSELSRLSQRELRQLISEAGGTVPVGPADKPELVDLLLALRPPEEENEVEPTSSQEESALEEGLRKIPLSAETLRQVLGVVRAARSKAAGGSEEQCAKRGFWESVADGSHAHAGLLKAVFGSCLCDRRQERGLFVPPMEKASYLESLQALVDEERQVQEDRRRHFCSKDFVPSAPGPLFPSAWKDLFTMHFGRGSSVSAGGDKARAGQLVAVASEAAARELVKKAKKPAFDKSTEDGTRFRIYRRGALEVRTLQQGEAAEEAIGAVFELKPSAPPAEHHPIVKVTEFVRSGQLTRAGAEADEGGAEAEEQASRGEGQRPTEEAPGLGQGQTGAGVEAEPEEPPSRGGRSEEEDGPAYCYFVVFETDLGDVIVAELLQDGALSWEENPPDVEDRYSRSRVLRVADCSGTGISVADVRRHCKRASIRRPRERRSSRRFARAAFAFPGGLLVNAMQGDGALPPVQEPLAKAGGAQAGPQAAAPRSGQHVRPPLFPGQAKAKPAPRPQGVSSR